MPYEGYESDEQRCGGTPDDDDGLGACDLCHVRLPWAQLNSDHDQETDDVFLSCKDEAACTARLNAERAEIEGGDPVDVTDLPY